MTEHPTPKAVEALAAAQRACWVYGTTETSLLDLAAQTIKSLSELGFTITRAKVDDINVVEPAPTPDEVGGISTGVAPTKEEAHNALFHLHLRVGLRGDILVLLNYIAALEQDRFGANAEIERLNGIIDSSRSLFNTMDAKNKLLLKALRFYAKNCPQNSLDGPEGFPTAIKAKAAIAQVESQTK